MIRTDRDLATMSLILSNLAASYPASAEQLLTHLARLDGYSGGGQSEKVSGAGSALTAVEAAADRRLTLVARLEQLRARRAEALAAIGALVREVDRATRMVTPDTPPPVVPLCRDGQHGRDGTLEWGDPLCMRTADKVGLCHAHYMASRRWREAHGIDTSRDYAEGVRA